MVKLKIFFCQVGIVYEKESEKLDLDENEVIALDLGILLNVNVAYSVLRKASPKDFYSEILAFMVHLYRHKAL